MKKRKVGRANMNGKEDNLAKDICEWLEKTFNPFNIIHECDIDCTDGMYKHGGRLAELDPTYKLYLEQCTTILEKVENESQEDIEDIVGEIRCKEQDAFFSLGCLYGMRRMGASSQEVEKFATDVIARMKKNGDSHLASMEWRREYLENRAAKAGRI